MSNILVQNKIYQVIDTIEKMTVADSFVVRSNKIGGGNGEAKFYVGNDSDITRNFFGKSGFNIKCFLLKKDLQQYLRDCEYVYINPEQLYRNRERMPTLWRERVETVNKLDEILWFNLDEQTQIAGPRVYVKSTSATFQLIRELSLPNITYISAIKLQTSEKEIIYYIRLFVDYFGEVEHPFEVVQEVEKITEEEISEEVKKQLI